MFRDYQIEAINKAINFLNDNEKINKKGFIVSPTGSGKSWIIAGIADRIEEPIIVLQPSKELLVQNYEKYTALGNKASIFSASLNTKETGHVTFATIGSIKERVNDFKKLNVRVIIIDECHLASSPSSVMKKFINELGNVRIIGLTATPIILMNTLEQGSVLKMLNRTKKSFFNEVIHVTQIEEIVNKGYWAKMVYEVYKKDTSMLRYNSSGSEFTEDSMIRMYNENNIEREVIQKVDSLRHRRGILIFCPSVAKAVELSNKIQGSKVVFGNMPEKERDEIIKKFKSGEIKIVVNVNVLSVGFDYPELDTVIDITPTASIARYYQKLGRACRPHPNKKEALLIDYSGNYERFGDLKDIKFINHPKFGWGMFNKDRMLTNVPIRSYNFLQKNVDFTLKEEKKEDKNGVRFNFGKYKDKLVKDVPKDYLIWCLKNVEWRSWNKSVKEEILKILPEKDINYERNTSSVER